MACREHSRRGGGRALLVLLTRLTHRDLSRRPMASALFAAFICTLFTLWNMNSDRLGRGHIQVDWAYGLVLTAFFSVVATAGTLALFVTASDASEALSLDLATGHDPTHAGHNLTGRCSTGRDRLSP